MINSQFSLLKDRRFGPLFGTQFLGAFNDNVFKNALIILITYYAAAKMGVDANLLVTGAAGIFILPFFLFSALAGQLADRYEKSQLIRYIKIAEILFMLTAAIGFYMENTYMLLGVLFLMGTQSAFFGPIKYSILPDHLKEDELIGANALVEAGTFLAILLGTILGGVLILKSGGILIVSIVTILMAVIGWLVSFKIPPAGPADADLKINYNLVSETWKIVNHTRRMPDVFLSILGISWFWLIGFVFLSQFPTYGKDIIGGNEDVVTLFLTVFSVGIGIGSLFCNKLLKGEVNGNYARMGALGMSVFILMLCYFSPSDVSAQMVTVSSFLKSFPNGWMILLSIAMIAVFGGIYIVPLYAIMQSRCEEVSRSRTIAANNIINAIFMVLGALVTMQMLSLDLGIVDIFFIMAAVNIPMAFFIGRVVKIQQAKRNKNNA